MAVTATSSRSAARQLVQSLTNAGLVDGYRILVHPVVVNKGGRLFENLEGRTDFRLVGVNPSARRDDRHVRAAASRLIRHYPTRKYTRTTGSGEEEPMKVVGILLCALSLSAIAEDAPCTCPDMLDLANRNNQVKAAIQAYEQQLSAWTAAGGAPGANEAARVSLQGRDH